MPKEQFISLEEAAQFEGLSYRGILSRVQRTSNPYKVRREPTENGGKDRILIAVSSLSPKGRRAYRKAQEVEKGVGEAVEDTKGRPWYVDIDHNWYIEHNRERYQEAVRLADQLRAYLDYGEAERTAHAQQTADRLGLSLRTLYRYADSMLEAGAWALRLEREDGQSRDYFRALSLCRKPRAAGTFPSLTEEQKALIENIWFDADFTDNGCTAEFLYEVFEGEAVRRGWMEYPSYKTICRYIKYLMDQPIAKSARSLAGDGLMEWKNRYQLKGKRNATTLRVMELVVADAHTFDVWVKYTYPNGKVKAIRPVLVAWMDMRSRRILGPVMCEHSNTQVVKESFVKMTYTVGLAEHIHTDNGKDFANSETLGQDRNIHYQVKEKIEMDSETMGFYLSMGGTKWSRSLPYQPWDKPIERTFRTFCMKYSKKFKSYVGSLTTSKTKDKRKKNIAKMLERGELLTLEEFYELFIKYLDEDYHQRVHRGLKDAGEQWTRPMELFEHAERFEKAAPPREYAAMLLMKAATATVTSQGINKFKTLYTAYELCHYKDKKVGIKWDIDDVTKLYVYDKDGKKICEAYSAEALEFGDRVSQEALERLLRDKNRQLAETRAYLAEKEMPYEQRVADGRAQCVGKLDLMFAHQPTPKVVSLPADKEYRGEVAARTTRRKAQAGNEFFSRKADEALASLRAMNE